MNATCRRSSGAVWPCSRAPRVAARGQRRPRTAGARHVAARRARHRHRRGRGHVARRSGARGGHVRARHEPPRVGVAISCSVAPSSCWWSTGVWLLLRAPERSVVLGVAALARRRHALPLRVRARSRLRPRTADCVAVRGGGVGARMAAATFASITVMAVVALPLVWFFQYSGGAGPQWGARYTLLSGALLLVAATVVLEGRRAAFVGALAIAVLITGFGIAWLSVRSTWVASGMEKIVDRQDQADHLGEPAPAARGRCVLRPARPLADRGAGRAARPGRARSCTTPATASSPTSWGTARRCRAASEPSTGDGPSRSSSSGPTSPSIS